jgi:membrane-bound lytic murein transglycosylase D
MKKWFALFCFTMVQSQDVIAYNYKQAFQKPKSDTVITQPKIDTTSKTENKIIDEVIESKKPIKKEKVAYLSQVTKYGFKNLFKNYSYNSSIPYSAQVNPYAESYMQDYLKSHENYLLNLKTRSVLYFNLIDGILSQYGLPRELKYLAVIESNLKTTALSSAGALGPWQFMSYTAKDYGLTVNQNQDDRMDYYKSTNAAAKYLLKLYKDLKDWLLVIAAYNGGPGRVDNAIRKSGSHDFWKLQYYLPEESRNHVKKFIATHYIMEAEDSNGNVAGSKFNYSKLSAHDTVSLVPALTSDEKANVTALQVSGKYISGVIAKNLDMDIIEFNHYNPEFDNKLATGDSYNLQLPNEKMELFTQKKYEILNECVEQMLTNVRIDSKTVYGNNPANKKK